MSITTRPRPRLLDLCCKAGGASAGYHAAGFDVVGVDIEAQPDYPFPFVQADALTVELAGFEVIAASPPCQLFSRATPAHRRGRRRDLIAPIRARLLAALAEPGGPWAYVIENVPGAPLRDPVTVCGDSLRLGVRRHRLFESNIALRGTECWHDRATPAVAVYGSYGQRGARRNHRAAGFCHQQVQLLVTQARRRGCRHCRCGQPLPLRPSTGRWPRYCSQACRQAAYRERQAANHANHQESA
jgi:DNA (cytosine-5)-methyltransferase 1